MPSCRQGLRTQMVPFILAIETHTKLGLMNITRKRHWSCSPRLRTPLGIKAGTCSRSWIWRLEQEFSQRYLVSGDFALPIKRRWLGNGKLPKTLSLEQGKRFSAKSLAALKSKNGKAIGLANRPTVHLKNPPSISSRPLAAKRSGLGPPLLGPTALLLQLPCSVLAILLTRPDRVASQLQMITMQFMHGAIFEL